MGAADEAEPTEDAGKAGPADGGDKREAGPADGADRGKEAETTDGVGEADLADCEGAADRGKEATGEAAGSRPSRLHGANGQRRANRQRTSGRK